MKLSDVVGNAGLSVYTQVALILFLVTFVAIVLYTYSRRNRDKFEQASSLPLEDDEPASPRAGDEGAIR